MSICFIHWYIFLLSFGLMSVLAIITERITRRFMTVDPVLHNFTTLELEIPSTGRELANIIGGIFLLPEEEKKITLKAVKSYLRLDFIFMFVVYFTLAILCLKISAKADFEWMKCLFEILAILQIPAWLADVYGNFYLLNKLKQGSSIKVPAKGEHRVYIRIVFFKWIITLSSTVICIATLLYYWVTGNFSDQSLYALIIAILISAVFLFILLREKKGADNALT